MFMRRWTATGRAACIEYLDGRAHIVREHWRERFAQQIEAFFRGARGCLGHHGLLDYFRCVTVQSIDHNIRCIKMQLIYRGRLDGPFTLTKTPFVKLIGRHETGPSFTSDFSLPTTVYMDQIKQYQSPQTI